LRARFSWLLVNLGTAFLASPVLGLFEGQLQNMVALAVLAPIVASQGGDATTQTMTVAVRAFRHHGHRCGRFLFIPEYRHPVVRPALGGRTLVSQDLFTLFADCTLMVNL
jgi:hypothetical protein